MVNTAAADGIMVLDARHEMLLGRKPGGSAVWKARQLPPIPAVETPADNIVPSPVKSPERQKDPGPPVRKPFKCEQCDFSSDTKHGLSVHNGKAHRPEPASERLLLICHRCDEFYYTSDSNYQIYCDHCM